MLGGVDPIIIFQFSVLAPTLSSSVSSIPIISQIPTLIEQPPIPLYMSETLTGILIDSEDKNIDIDTSVETLTDGKTPDVSQKGINSSVTINMRARKDSVGIMLLSAMMDLVFDRLTSKEYAVSYLNGATTIFRGVIQSYAVNQNAGDEMLSIKLEISKGAKTPVKTETPITVPKTTGALPL